MTSRRVVGFSIVAGICLGMTALARAVHRAAGALGVIRRDVDAKVAQLEQADAQQHDTQGVQFSSSRAGSRPRRRWASRPIRTAC